MVLILAQCHFWPFPFWTHHGSAKWRWRCHCFRFSIQPFRTFGSDAFIRFTTSGLDMSAELWLRWFADTAWHVPTRTFLYLDVAITNWSESQFSHPLCWQDWSCRPTSVINPSKGWPARTARRACVKQLPTVSNWERHPGSSEVLLWFAASSPALATWNPEVQQRSKGWTVQTGSWSREIAGRIAWPTRFGRRFSLPVDPTLRQLATCTSI